MPAAPFFLQLIADFGLYLGLLVRRRKAIASENLFLRRQLALYQERKVDPRQIDPATRITLALLSRLFNWRDALIVVQPKTLIRWHRAAAAARMRLLERMIESPLRPYLGMDPEAFQWRLRPGLLHRSGSDPTASKRAA